MAKVIQAALDPPIKWGVSLPTYWVVLRQWEGAYLGFTLGSTSSC